MATTAVVATVIDIMEIKIRKAEKRDAQRLVQLLETIALLHHKGRPDIYGNVAKYNVQDIEKKISNNDEIILVAVNDDDTVLGYTMSKIIDVLPTGNNLGYKKMYIDDVCVDELYRKHGIGKLLMSATKQVAIDHKCHICDLNVWSFNENAIKFYESCGMKKQRIFMEYVLDE